MCELLQIQTTVSLEWLIGIAGVVLSTVAIAWANMRINMALITAKLIEIEKDIVQDRKAVEILKTETKELYTNINAKLDKILENQSDLKVEMANKEDRK
tara:strand:+ start:411 stop:707 length:297 start_codon:yes stop_codon:yes gene_type:complete